jgi:hypothetical protein
VRAERARDGAAPDSLAELTLVDAHVHVHRCFGLERFLEAAHANFAAAAGAWRPFTGVLLLTEGAGEDRFAELQASAVTQPAMGPAATGLRAGGAVTLDRPPATGAPGRAGSCRAAPGGWRFERTAEDCALRAFSGERELLLVAGRQVATSDGLELLVFGPREGFEDGRPLAEALDRARTRGLVHAVPWGAGKWLFSRGRLLSRLVAAARDPGFCLGDEGGRPVFWRRVRHFEEARRRGIRVLRGTDPLPFPREVSRPGSFGFALTIGLDRLRPARRLLEALRDPSIEIRDYGRLERPLAFVVHQLAMQRLKRARRSASEAGPEPAPAEPAAVEG